MGGRMLRAGLAALFLASAGAGSAQPQPPNNQPVWTAELTSLGIDPKLMRQGADGNNPEAPNAANYDESQVRAYSLPALMGTMPPHDAAGWPERRAQLVTLVEDNLLAAFPTRRPMSL